MYNPLKPIKNCISQNWLTRNWQTTKFQVLPKAFAEDKFKAAQVTKFVLVEFGKKPLWEKNKILVGRQCF